MQQPIFEILDDYLDAGTAEDISGKVFSTERPVVDADKRVWLDATLADDDGEVYYRISVLAGCEIAAWQWGATYAGTTSLSYANGVRVIG